MMKLYAVRIFVSNWDASCAFYRDKLKLPERFRDDALGWAEYDVGGPCLGVERVDQHDAEGNSLVGRFVGATLQVENIEVTFEALTSGGVEFVGPPEKQSWGGTLAFIEDPDGNVITLLQS